MSEGLADVQLHLVDSIDDAMEMKRWIGQRRDVLAVDTETTGLSFVHDKVRLVQLGDAESGWAVPWDLWGGVVVELLQSYEGQLVAHNAKYDSHMLEASTSLTLPRHRLDDTMVMAHILDPTRSVALKTLTTYLIDPKAAQMQSVLDQGMTNNGWGWATVPLDYSPYWQYAALDTVLTARLWHILKPQVVADAPKAYDLEMARTWVVQKQERNGCQVDVPYTREKLSAFEVYVDQAGTWCETNYGVSAGSDAKIIERLQQDGIEFTKMTSSGSRHSLDKEVLEGIIATTGHPLATTVLQRRRLQKLASTYLENFLTMADANGVLHPNVRVLGARTSRESITEPALQTLPRKSEANAAAIVVRNCITARDEDHLLVMADFDQVEMRQVAHFCRDPGLVDAFAEGDFFVNISRELYADPTLIKSDPRRQLVKNGMYALSYGAGAEKIALTTNQALPIVQEFLTNLGVRYPGIKQFQRQVATVAKQRAESEGVAYVRSPLTNRKHVADPGKEYALVNFLIQGTSAEIFKMKTIELDAAGFGDYMILGVHDEVVLDLPTDMVADAVPVIREVMSDLTTFAVPLTVGIDTAFRWGEKGS